MDSWSFIHVTLISKYYLIVLQYTRRIRQSNILYNLFRKKKLNLIMSSLLIIIFLLLLHLLYPILHVNTIKSICKCVWGHISSIKKAITFFTIYVR